MKKFVQIGLVVLLIFLSNNSVFAQGEKKVSKIRHTINGYIKDGATGETLIGATISLKGNTKGIASNIPSEAHFDELFLRANT